ncbi:MAG: tRNA 4-thiouridine(8) synthase ThiI [Clostridiales bacterium]|nr:tRNA 4-thiouridine(8) synthase ThiI [Clostridiales bacterium]
MRRILLVRFGEVFLKGQNRPFFMRKLIDHIKLAVRDVGGRVWMSEGRIYVSDFSDLDECIRRVTKVFGVHSVSPAVEMDKDNFEAICQQAAELMRPLSGTFKVLARRSDKRYPLDSPAIMREAGGYILERLPDLQVDVNHPDHTLMIEIRDHAYLSVERFPAVEGMPMGTNGKACLLLSGGIDSPVAGFMIAKRGVELCCVHYHSFPYTSERAREKVLELARLLSEYCGKMRVFVVPFTEIQMQIHQKCPENYTTLIMRRYMMRIAQILAERDGAQALITGESIGQVASQTMEALGCTDEVVSLPVFRPCIGMDKSEIIERAQKIGTFETSSLPYEDCCTVFTPKHPATHPRKALIAKAEEALDSEALIAAAIEGTEVVEVG